MRAWFLCPLIGSGSTLDPFRAKYGRRDVPGIERGTTQAVHPDVCLRQIDAAPGVVSRVLGESDVAPIAVEQSLGDAIGVTASARLSSYLAAYDLPPDIAPAESNIVVWRRLTGMFAVSQRARGLFREGFRARLARAGASLSTPWALCPAALQSEILSIRDSFRWSPSDIDPSGSMELREVLAYMGDGFERLGQQKAARFSNSLPVSDTFSSGTTLETHTTDSSHSWGGEADHYSISGGAVSTESQGNFLASVDPSDSETDVLAEITGDLGGGTNTNYRLGVGCRVDTGAWATFDGYLTRLISLGASSVVHDAFEATDGGNTGLTEIIDGSTGLDESTEYKLGLECIGSTIDAYLDEVSETSGVGVTDATHDGSNTLVVMYQRATGSSATLFAAEAASSGNDLTATDLESASELDSPALGQVFGLTATDLESASELDSPALGQTFGLAGLDLEITVELGSPALDQADNALTPADLETTVELSSPTLQQVRPGGGGLRREVRARRRREPEELEELEAELDTLEELEASSTDQATRARIAAKRKRVRAELAAQAELEQLETRRRALRRSIISGLAGVLRGRL